MSETRSVQVIRRDTGQVVVESARWCESRLCRLKGLMFRRRLGPGEALLLVHPQEGVLSSSIHMFFVFFSLAALWINDQGRVTSARLAKPWRPYYASPEPARYVLEADPRILKHVAVGDRLVFEPLSAKPAVAPVSPDALGEA